MRLVVDVSLLLTLCERLKLRGWFLYLIWEWMWGNID
jgi:hypothetical protein